MKQSISDLRSEVQEVMWTTSDFDAAAQAALKLIGTYFSADSAYIVECGQTGTVFQNTYIWETPDAPQMTHRIQNMNPDQISEYIKILNTGEKALYTCVETVSCAHASLMRCFSIYSALQCPIIEEGRVMACLGIIDSCQQRKDWQSCAAARQMLLSVTRSLGAFLLKTRYAERAERYQKQLEKALAASEAKADTAYEILDSIAAGVVVLRMPSYDKLLPEYGNLGQYRMLRIPRTAVQAQVPEQEGTALESQYFDDAFAGVHPDDLERVKKQYAAGYGTDHFVVKKYRLLTGSGDYVWVNADLRLREVKPQYRLFYATYTDITEEQNLQIGLAASLEQEKRISAQLTKANHAKNEFLSRMSHEIRTPMNAIIGLTTIAAAHLDDRSRMEDCLAKIGISSKHLLSIINDVLDMSKIDDGKMTLASEPFALQKLLSNVCSLYAARCEEAGQQFGIRLVDVENEDVVGDFMRVQQILLNLLSNAEKFTPAGGSIRLEVRQLPCAAERAVVRFTVSDTGIGMKQTYLKRIFEPFEQADASISQKFGGTGLGLSITKNLAELMGGKISVRSAPGEGTDFSVEIPFGLPQEKRSPAPKEDITHLRVLVVDDDKGTCEHASLLLDRMGIQGAWVLNGAQAIWTLQQAHERGEDYDVCFVDWKMPGMDGVETARQIRKLLGPDILIIILTAYDWAAIERQAREAGVDAFVGKPFFQSTLHDALVSVKGRHAAPEPRQLDKKTKLSGHVLLAEDNEINREIAVELLDMMGLTADCAYDGQHAVERFTAARPGTYQIILMDIQMPVMDGYGAAKAIRACTHPEAAVIPIVAMTANAFHEDVKAALAAGMNGHIAKPVDPETLYHTLQKYLK